ncbi:MAG TPA: hypothetical protein VGH81_07855 [Rudaea sp.]|jgi:hypothetical protein
MSAVRLRALILMLAACAALSAVNAHACSATSQDVFVVGNKSADSACNYSTIHDAVMAATCPAGTKIYLTDEVSYTGQQVITDRNVSLIGRAPGAKCGTLTVACGPIFPCPTAPLQTIHGSIKIRGTSNVVIQYLTITDGNGVADDHGTTYGGGIDYAATGELDIETSTIEDNTANNGGGIRFQGYGGHADLYLHSHTLIDSNEATNGGSGGGIRLEGTATLHADEPNILIWQNLAADKGGGIVVISPAVAHISSIGDFFFGTPVGVVWKNNAQNGGGIAVVGSDVDSGNVTEGHVTLAASDLHYPVRIEGNTATSKGGGIYLKPYVFAFPPSDTVNFVSLSASGYRIDGNIAPEGSAIYVDTDTAFGQDYYGGIVNLTPVTCLPLIDCDIIDGNQTLDGPGQHGSTVLVQTSGTFDATGVRMRDNYGGAHLIREVGSKSVVLDTCLLSGNHDLSGNDDFSDALIEAEYSMYIDQCTIATNAFGGSHVIDSPGDTILTNTLIDQPGKGAYNGSLDHLYAHNIVATDTAGLPADPTIEQQQPLFVDAAHGDFRLIVVRTGSGSLVASQGVDFAPTGMAGVDIGGRTLDRDISGFGAPGNLRDLGAFEMQPIADRVFADGFGDPISVAY